MLLVRYPRVRLAHLPTPLEPVYTGKALWGLIGMIRNGRFGRGENLVFMHTGGLPGLFAYREDFAG